MKRWVSIAVAVTAVCAQVWAEGQPDLAAALKKVVEQNFAMSQAENMDGVLATMDTRSPAYATARDVLKTVFDPYDLKYDLLAFHCLGSDGDYAVARVFQRTTKVKGPDFKNNELDSLYVFRQENGAWKLWNQVILETKYIDQPASPAPENK